MEKLNEGKDKTIYFTPYSSFQDFSKSPSGIDPETSCKDLSMLSSTPKSSDPKHVNGRRSREKLPWSPSVSEISNAETSADVDSNILKIEPAMVSQLDVSSAEIHPSASIASISKLLSDAPTNAHSSPQDVVGSPRVNNKENQEPVEHSAKDDSVSLSTDQKTPESSLTDIKIELNRRISDAIGSLKRAEVLSGIPPIKRMQFGLPKSPNNTKKSSTLITSKKSSPAARFPDKRVLILDTIKEKATPEATPILKKAANVDIKVESCTETYSPVSDLTRLLNSKLTISEPYKNIRGTKDNLTMPLSIESLKPRARMREAVKPTNFQTSDLRNQKFICSDCGAKFFIKSLMDAHRHVAHGVDKNTGQRKKLMSQSTITMENQAGNQCRYCDKKFALERALHLHLLMHCQKIPLHDKRNLNLNVMDHVPKTARPVILKPSLLSGSSSLNATSMNSAVDKKPMELRCPFCLCIYLNLMEFAEHIRNYHPK